MKADAGAWTANNAAVKVPTEMGLLQSGVIVGLLYWQASQYAL